MKKIWKYLDGKKRNIATAMTTIAAIAGLYGVPDRFITSINLIAASLGGVSLTSQAIQRKNKNDK